MDKVNSFTYNYITKISIKNLTNKYLMNSTVHMLKIYNYLLKREHKKGGKQDFFLMVKLVKMH